MMVACEVTARIRLRSSRSKPFMRTDDDERRDPECQPAYRHERDERLEAAAVLSRRR